MPDGEFNSQEHHAAHMAALKEELRGKTGKDADAVKAELKRVEKPGKFQADLDAAEVAEQIKNQYAEEHRVNPGLVEHPEGFVFDRPEKPGPAA